MLYTYVNIIYCIAGIFCWILNFVKHQWTKIKMQKMFIKDGRQEVIIEIISDIYKILCPQMNSYAVSHV